ncbi:MAG: GNVR domain-containing protein [Pirellulaceae bacterium]
MAQLLVKTVTDVFMEKHLDVAQTKGSQDFFKSQADEAEKQLTDLVDAKTNALKEREIVSIESQRELLNARLSNIDRELFNAKGNLEQATAEIDDLRNKIDGAEAEIVAAKLEGSDGTWSGMRQRVYELELLEQQQSSKYTDNHRSLIETREQLKGARAILAKLRSDRVDQSTTPNPAKLRMEEALQLLQTKVVGLQSIIEEQELQKAKTQQEVHELAKFELDQLKIDRNIALLQSNLQMLQEKREEARVLNELQQEKISNISLFQPATFVERPAKPNKKLVAAGFVFLGLMTGICLAFVREATNTTLRTAEHIESNLRCPVVFKVPYQRRLSLMPRFNRPGEENPMRPGCQTVVSDVLLSRARPLSAEKRGKTLGVIGVDHGCGASTLASALAMAASDDCRLKTLLIDGDCQGRTVSKSFGLNGAPGLMELVAGNASAEECVQRLDYSGLSLISYSKPSGGDLDSDPRDVLYAFEELSHQCDLVIVDLPPASHPDQTVAVAKHLDHVIVVVESEKTEIAAAERLLRRLSEGNVQVVGVVLNKTIERLPKFIGRLVNA